MERRFLAESEELALVEAAIAGDPEAWGILYNAFLLPVRGFIAGRIGVTEDAEDLAQECFIRARRSLDQGLFDRQYRLYTLLRNVALHVVQDYWRHRARADSRLSEQSHRIRSLAAETRSFHEPLERLELLRLVFVCGAKPHQILMFGFVKLLQWRPREIVKERAESSLMSLTDEFLESYYAPLEHYMSQRTFHSTFCAPLLAVMDSPAVEVYGEREYDDRGMSSELAVGSLALKVFFGGDPAANISDWCDRVRTCTRKLIAATNIETHGQSRPRQRGN
ncbi:hypothetical protein JXA88_01745 [Candidatus Fermentibacteria bacterium]|nr:hypothetical protein [Candidatus Fermentibacteria bacterium]